MGRICEVTNDEPCLQLDSSSVNRIIDRLDHHSSCSIPNGTLGIAFVDEPACCDLHLRFFNDPEVTDVMTFPGDPEDAHAGEIAICPGIAARRCREEQIDFREELTLYLVHAWLHLAGYDDKDSLSAEKMRQGEAALMDYLGNDGSLLEANWRDSQEN